MLISDKIYSMNLFFILNVDLKLFKHRIVKCMIVSSPGDLQEFSHFLVICMDEQSCWVPTVILRSTQNEQKKENCKIFQQKIETNNLHITGIGMKKKLSTLQILFQCLALLMVVFAIHILGLGDNTHNLNILTLKDLPQIHPLGCFKSKRILEGFA